MLLAWLEDLLQWIKKTLGGKKPPPTVLILEQYSNPKITYVRIYDGSIPGCVDLWKLERHNEQSTFWLCAINTGILRSEIGLLGYGSLSSLLSNRYGKMAGSIREQLQAQSIFFTTHYFICGWLEPFTIIYQGRQFRDLRCTNIRVIAGDFQGSNPYAGDKYILRYCQTIAHRLAKDEFRGFRHHNTWKAGVKSIDWYQFLEGLARSPNGGIDPNHRIQVRRIQE